MLSMPKNFVLLNSFHKHSALLQIFATNFSRINDSVNIVEYFWFIQVIFDILHSEKIA